MVEKANRTVEDANEMTIRHYLRPEIKDTIIRVSQDDNKSRAGNGNFEKWYRNKRMSKTHFDLSNENDYNYLVNRYQTLYWTLNLFDSHFYTLNYSQQLHDNERIPKSNSAQISQENTSGYTFGVDIDKTKGHDIHDPKVIKAIEDMARFYVSEFKEHAPNSVYATFSGGGIHVYVHHKVFEPVFDKFELPSQRAEGFKLLCGIFALCIDDIKNRFFDKYPEHEEYAKPDSLNNAKRIFKSIYSIHRTQPYAVIPLDTNNIKIDFDKARLPIKEDVIKLGNVWYMEYDTDNAFLKHLKQYEPEAFNKVNHKTPTTTATTGEGEPLLDISTYPPCIKNMLEHKTGSTRALRFFASFLSDMRVPEQQASKMFYDLANKWNAATSNIFETSYGALHCARCEKLNDPVDVGFPNGNSIHNLDVCKPDVRCLQIGRTNPRYYTDRKANNERMIYALNNP